MDTQLHIFAVGKIHGDEILWHIAPLPVKETPPPPTRDERADEAAAQADFECYYRWCQAERLDAQDARDDEEFWRHHC